MIAINDGDAGAIVAAIFEATKSIEQNGCREPPALSYWRCADPKSRRSRFSLAAVHARASTGHDSANTRDYHGRRRRHPPVPVNERSRQAGGAARRKISHRRYSDQQLPELGSAV